MTAHHLGYEIACDGPTGQNDCPNSAAVRPRFVSRTAAQVRADGRRDGWTRQPGRDLCPDCTTTHRKEPTR
ncbi:hypothetical protein [Streptomyces sp. NPDC048445]|uniref:hypothetical protein n=1 Tax=Streptomyces sp. NPDC048445 TaxID=3365553 RepID=UPI0037180DD7